MKIQFLKAYFGGRILSLSPQTCWRRWCDCGRLHGRMGLPATADAVPTLATVSAVVGALLLGLVGDTGRARAAAVDTRLLGLALGFALLGVAALLPLLAIVAVAVAVGRR